MNAILAPWTAPFGLQPFAALRDEDFAPAFDAALSEARANIAAIAGDTNPPSFANTIDALEQAEATLDRVSGLFYNLASADANDTREALMRDLAPKMSAFSSEVTNNKALFARIESLWNARDSLDLTAEQSRVLMLYHRMFVRSGARLDGDQAARLTEVMARLATLSTQFSQNVLAEERAWFMELDEDDLAGLPDFVVASARAAGAERGLSSPVITLNRALIVPFLQFSTRRALREKAYEAWVARGANGNAHDNRAIAAEILALRAERAKLLGYTSFAEFKLETEMARSPQAVRDLLMAMWEPSRKRAEADAAKLTEMLQADGIKGRLEPWDWRYYSEKWRQAEHAIDEAALKPYFSLNAMLDALFDCANRLFGLEFSEIDGPFYHPDVRGWNVTRGGEHIAVFLGDYFARPSKRSGAWCSAMRSQRKLGGDTRPIVVNVCNSAKSDPALLSYDDARTMFHEFGHALHQMLSDVTYGFVAGTNVARDFVELPSQLYEHWLEVPEVLARHARHHATGAPMPDDMLTRLLAARSHDQAFQTVEFIASAMVDLEFHVTPDAPQDPMQKQAEVLGALGLPHAIRMRHATPHFGHVFSGDGYSSGYYSYMWSAVLDCDAFAAFEEAGDPFHAETAKRLESFILSAGGSDDAAALYTAFRGKLPGVEALLKARGLLDAA